MRCKICFKDSCNLWMHTLDEIDAYNKSKEDYKKGLWDKIETEVEMYEVKNNWYFDFDSLKRIIDNYEY